MHWFIRQFDRQMRTHHCTQRVLVFWRGKQTDNRQIYRQTDTNRYTTAEENCCKCFFLNFNLDPVCIEDSELLLPPLASPPLLPQDACGHAEVINVLENSIQVRPLVRWSVSPSVGNAFINKCPEAQRCVSSVFSNFFFEIFELFFKFSNFSNYSNFSKTDGRTDGTLLFSL